MKDNKGIMGIGTLIIFIAIIIVAAVAAAILISSSGTFGTKALATQKGTDEEITTGVIITTVYGRDGTEGHLDFLDIMGRLRTGSDPMNFNTTVITIDSVIHSELLIYSAENTTDTGFYYINYISSGVTHIDGYLTLGDTVIITANLNTPVTEHMPIKVQIIPRVGSLSRLEFNAPNSIIHYREFLWP